MRWHSLERETQGLTRVGAWWTIPWYVRLRLKHPNRSTMRNTGKPADAGESEIELGHGCVRFWKQRRRAEGSHSRSTFMQNMRAPKVLNAWLAGTCILRRSCFISPAQNFEIHPCPSQTMDGCRRGQLHICTAAQAALKSLRAQGHSPAEEKRKLGCQTMPSSTAAKNCVAQSCSRRKQANMRP